jgi:cation transport ATPase
MSIMVGTGRGASAGVLIRNAEALETLEKVDVLVVDKTGTLYDIQNQEMKDLEAHAGCTGQEECVPIWIISREYLLMVSTR